MPESKTASQRKTLADQIDRLDRTLDGLAEAIQGAVADAVRDAVKSAVAELIADPAFAGKLREAAAPAPAFPAFDAIAPAEFVPEPKPRAYVANRVRLMLATGRDRFDRFRRPAAERLSGARVVACRWADKAWARRKPFLAAVGVALAASLLAYAAGPVLDSLIAGASGFGAVIAAAPSPAA